jgi:hypothetical protein
MRNEDVLKEILRLRLTDGDIVFIDSNAIDIEALVQSTEGFFSVTDANFMVIPVHMAGDVTLRDAILHLTEPQLEAMGLQRIPEPEPEYTVEEAKKDLAQWNEHIIKELEKKPEERAAYLHGSWNTEVTGDNNGQ